MESFNLRDFEAMTGCSLCFVQHNHSRSHRNVLRGLHYQLRNPQGKWIRVVRGEIYDVAVDLRPDSRTFGQWVSETLSEQNRFQLWIPPGFAHGFAVLSEVADVEYCTTGYYDPHDERCIAWNDKTLDIVWPLTQPELSERDRCGASFAQAKAEILQLHRA